MRRGKEHRVRALTTAAKDASAAALALTRSTYNDTDTEGGVKDGGYDGVAAAALEFKMRLLRAALGTAAMEAVSGGGWLRPQGGWSALQTVLSELTRLWARLRQVRYQLWTL